MYLKYKVVWKIGEICNCGLRVLFIYCKCIVNLLLWRLHMNHRSLPQFCCGKEGIGKKSKAIVVIIGLLLRNGLAGREEVVLHFINVERIAPGLPIGGKERIFAIGSGLEHKIICRGGVGEAQVLRSAPLVGRVVPVAHIYVIATHSKESV